MPTREELQKAADIIAKGLVDRGCLIEAGFHLFRGYTMHPDAPSEQVDEMRFAWMAGSQHLFASIMGILDPGEEPTARDLMRLDNIHNELERFRKELELRVARTKGSA